MKTLNTLLLLLAIVPCVAGCGGESDNATVVPDPFARPQPKPIPEETIEARKAEILAAVAKMREADFAAMEKILAATPDAALEQALKRTDYRDFAGLMAAYKQARRDAGFVEKVDITIKPSPHYGIWYDPRPDWEVLKAEILAKKNSGAYEEALALFDKIDGKEWPANEEIKREIDAIRAEISQLAAQSE